MDRRDFLKMMGVASGTTVLAGCNLDRNIREIIEAAGFTITQMDEFYWEKAPKSMGYTYLGTATR